MDKGRNSKITSTHHVTNWHYVTVELKKDVKPNANGKCQTIDAVYDCSFT